jgi:CRISPR-associated protein Cas5d
MSPPWLGLEVHGDLACFTRPEMKVERMSYPVIPPSAARGIFEAIYAKPPEFRWQVRRIEVLSMPSYLTLRRNEVKDKANANAVAAWMRGTAEPEPLWADGDRDLLGTDAKGRTQRQTVALKGVHYRLWAEILPWPGVSVAWAALAQQFERRARHGKCFYQPYFGCREFPAFFRWAEPGAASPAPIPLDRDLGLMVYDVFDLSRPGTATSKPAVSLFRAALRGGVLEVPEYASPEVLKTNGGLL